MAKRSLNSISYMVDEFGTIKILDDSPQQEPSRKSTKVKKVFKSSKLMTNCPICKIRVRADRLEKHKQKVHGALAESVPSPPSQNRQLSTDKVAKKTLVKCPECSSLVREDRLTKHLNKVHFRRSILSTSRNSHSNSAAKKKHGKMQDKAADIFDDIDYPQENLYQSNFETRYGNKYLGQMRRDWDGTFGSLPLHDDYDDEGGPD